MGFPGSINRIPWSVHHIIRQILLSVLLTSYVKMAVAADVTCVKDNSCRCTLSDNSYYYDLTPMVEGTTPPFFHDIAGSGATYFYDPCRDFTITAPLTQCTNVAVCKKTMPDELYYNLGMHATSEFVYLTNGPIPLRVLYHNGLSATEVNTTVQLICDTTGISRLNLLTETASLYLFELRTPYACPQPLPPAPSKLTPGGILCIIFVVVVTVYFVGGFIYLFFFKYESGPNAIPHYEFWSSLPGLIKDGFLYLCSCVCGDTSRMTSSGPTYESI